jgi:hypothetical protein
VLSPVDRVSELLFGLFMALTFVGAVSVAEAGQEEIRKMLTAAPGLQPRLGPRRRGHVPGSHGSRRSAGYGSWKVGFMMAALGAALVGAIRALGG